ncbi:MAG TPA: hypothetical protein VGC97_07280 [Pyrinomonadaceae bacterium]|jgi:hypothetical protein
MLKIKLFVALAFLAFAACAFLLPGNKSLAQTNESAKKRDQVLEKVAGYKTWKQVQKPEPLAATKAEVLTISDSSVAG